MNADVLALFFNPLTVKSIERYYKESKRAKLLFALHVFAVAEISQSSAFFSAL
jgi:hypothetical protein